ncbi:MAG: hypothetical protein LBP76_05040 [Treponema sp.]|jgi:hypothetical protein|nr:hypothetical protein [Treponema sp.]
MDKRRTFVGLIAILLVCGFGLPGCSTPPTQLSKALTDRAGDGDSEIVIERKANFFSAMHSMNIFIDGELKLHIDNGKRAKIVIPNGRHIIHAGVRNNVTEEIAVESNSNLIPFMAKVSTMGAVKLTKVSEVALEDLFTKGGIVEALEKATQILIPSLQKGVKTAIVNVSSADKDQAVFIAGNWNICWLMRSLPLWTGANWIKYARNRISS